MDDYVFDSQANILEYNLLAVNVDYILSIPSPKFPWAQMKPHKLVMNYDLWILRFCSVGVIF